MAIEPLIVYVSQMKPHDLFSMEGEVKLALINNVPYFTDSKFDPQEVQLLKLTACPTKEGTCISFYRYWDTALGWSSQAIEIAQRFEKDGTQRWQITFVSDGKNRGGRLEQKIVCHSDGTPCKNYNNPFFPTLSDASELVEVEQTGTVDRAGVVIWEDM